MNNFIGWLIVSLNKFFFILKYIKYNNNNNNNNN